MSVRRGIPLIEGARAHMGAPDPRDSAPDRQTPSPLPHPQQPVPPAALLVDRAPCRVHADVRKTRRIKIPRGKYVRTTELVSVPSTVSRADVADFLVEACESPTFVGKGVQLGG